MIIKPYHEIADEPFVAGDFPALKHFWPCREGGNVIDSLVDVVAGADVLAIFGSFGPVAGNANGVTILNQSYSVAEALSVIGTKAFMFLTVTAGSAANANNALKYGTLGAATGGVSSGSNTSTILTDGTNTLTIASAMTTKIAARCLVSDGTTATSFQVDASTFSTPGAAALSAATPAGITNIIATDNVLLVGPGANDGVYGMAMFIFDNGLPPLDVCKAGAAWCHKQWTENSNITMYPGFKGLA